VNRIVVSLFFEARVLKGLISDQLCAKYLVRISLKVCTSVESGYGINFIHVFTHFSLETGRFFRVYCRW